MARSKHLTQTQPPDDPFAERHRSQLRGRYRLMGGDFRFETDNPRLAQIARTAYSGLPPHALRRATPRFLVRLALTHGTPSRARAPRAIEPPPMRSMAAGGILCGASETANFVALSPEHRAALIVVTREMLAFPYHIRYEMLEFAVYLLASRAQQLVPLHAACVGRGGEGILLLGSSGSGKSTVSLHCLLEGLDFLAEDSVLVDPSGFATGVANFLHVRADSLRFLADPAQAALIRASPVIRRRSGVEKFELDLRRPPFRLAPTPLRISAVVSLSPQRALTRALLAPMRREQLLRTLDADQRYAANQPGWSGFIRRVSRLPIFELSRGRHPLQAVEALKELLPPSKRVRP